MRPTDRFGGHIVSGHVDGVGTVESINEDARALRWRFAAPAALLRNMERARLALNLDELYERGDARTHLLHALSGLRLALLPGVEVMLEPAEQPQLPPGLDGAPL